jgi:proline iminopeptidase
MIRLSLVLLATLLVAACNEKENTQITVNSYFQYNDTLESAGIKMIPIQTPVGNFKVWTKRFGNNPKIKILLLHGGPAMTHEYMECFETFFQRQGFEFYEYDQLGSYYSDQPKDSSLYTTERFVEEVEQVRLAIGADPSNFYLLGNSWGGILAMEYALKYQQHLKGPTHI